MLPFQIGNWRITKDYIEHVNSPDPDYVIHIDRLDERGPNERSNMYDWMVHLPIKSWISDEDVYAFNTALIFALEYFKIGFSGPSFVESIIEQKK